MKIVVVMFLIPSDLEQVYTTFHKYLNSVKHFPRLNSSEYLYILPSFISLVCVCVHISFHNSRR